MIDQTQHRGRAAGVTPLKNFVTHSQLFVTGWQKQIRQSESQRIVNQLKYSGHKEMK